MKRSLFAVYATGTASFSVMLLYIDPPLIAGVDAGGVTYSGDIKYDEMENLHDVSLAMSGTEDQEVKAFRRGLTDVLEGKRAIPITKHRPPANLDKFPPPPI